MKVCKVCHFPKGSRAFAYGRRVCNSCRRRYYREYHHKNKQYEKVRNAKYRLSVKQRVLTEYSHKRCPICRCCFITELTFLSLDHIKGGGEGDRKLHGGGHAFYLSVVRRKFPKGFQVLCHNCQFGKQIHNGFCTHHPRIDLTIAKEGNQ